MPLSIIGAGFGRTGTRSMQLALNELGYPCFHMHELMLDCDRLSHFQDAHAGRDVDWESAYAGYTAAVDYPTMLYWRELVERYPDAWVLLTVRPADDWYRSTRTTIYEHCIRARAAGSSDLTEYLWDSIWDGRFGGRFEDRDHAIGVYQDHLREVEDRVDPARLLVHPIGSGWAPLCDALGRDTPEMDYPSTNSGSAFRARMREAFPEPS